MTHRLVSPLELQTKVREDYTRRPLLGTGISISHQRSVFSRLFSTWLLCDCEIFANLRLKLYSRHSGHQEDCLHKIAAGPRIEAGFSISWVNSNMNSQLPSFWLLQYWTHPSIRYSLFSLQPFLITIQYMRCQYNKILF